MKDNFRYMLSNWLKWDKKSLNFFFLWVPALVLQPLVTAYIPKAMIDAIGKGVTVQNMTVIVALLSLLLTLTIWLDPFMKELVRGGANTLGKLKEILSLARDYFKILEAESTMIYATVSLI